MRVGQAASLLGGLLAATACNPLAGQGLVAADPIECAASVSLFSHDFAGNVGEEAERTVESSEFSPPDRAEIRFDDGSRLTFTTSGELAPALPPNGTVTIRGNTSNCFGEGCDYTFYTLSVETLGVFVELGLMNTIDDDARTWGPLAESPLSMRLGTGNDVCPDTGGEVPSVLRVETDDGVIGVLPGETAEVSLQATPWRAAAAASRREEFIQEEGCPDCASAGRHSITQLDALLYRLENGP